MSANHNMNICEIYRADACQCVNGCEYPNHTGKPSGPPKQPKNGLSGEQKFEMFLGDFYRSYNLQQLYFFQYQNAESRRVFLRQWAEDKLPNCRFLHDWFVNEFS